MDIMLLFVVIVFGLALFGLLYLVHHLRRNVLNPSGKGAARRTRGALKRYAGIRRFRVLGDVKIGLKGKTAEIENILIGFFGVLLVHTLGARGEYYGTLDGAQWSVTLNEKRTAFPNPVLAQQKAEALLRGVFAANQLYSIPVEHIVYLESRGKKTGFFITNSGEVLLPGKLKDYLHKAKFDVDTGLDVDKVAKAIENATA
jgi:hypothetical protein